MKRASHGSHCICHMCSPGTLDNVNSTVNRPILGTPVDMIPLFPGSTPVDGNLRRVGRR